MPVSRRCSATPEHGRWLLAPVGEVRRSTRRYRHDTLILESVYETDEGSVRAIEFMPPRGVAPDIVRIVEGLDGTSGCDPSSRSGSTSATIVPWVRRIDHARVAIAGPDALCLRTPVEIHGEEMTTVSEFTIEAGQRIPFVLTWFPSHEPLPREIDPEVALTETEEYWLEWAARCDHTGVYHEEIHQSLRLLKALTYAPTGGIVAAPTTSLPEWIGGVRNWDYRYCWLRDATLTLLAMLNAGYRDEAMAWRQWLLRAVAGDPADVQIMYGIAGERRLDERVLEWLPGFEESRPVRVGNAASQQLQLDVYGEVIDALYQTRRHGAPADDNVWSLTLQLLELARGGLAPRRRGHLGGARAEPALHPLQGDGVGRVRPRRRVPTRSSGASARSSAGASSGTRSRPRCWHSAWNDEKGAYSQYYGSDELDASVLLMGARRVPPGDRRAVRLDGRRDPP